MTSRPSRTRTNARWMSRKTTNPEGGSKAHRRNACRCASARRNGYFDGAVDRQHREPMRLGAAANGRAGRHRPEGPTRWEHRTESVSALTAKWPRTVNPAGEVALQHIFGVADHGRTDRGWRTTRKGKPDPRRFGAAVKAIPDGPAMR
jgi:hypothetical protein